MKQNIINRFITVAMLLAAAFIQFSCKDDIETPNQYVRITNQTSVTAPYGGAQYILEIESNSAWQITFAGDDISWISATPLKGNGNGSAAIKIDPNIGASAVARDVTVKVSMQNNHAISTELPIAQNGPAAPGTTISVAGLRALASNITVDQPIYTITENSKVIGFVCSDVTAGNFRSNAFAMQDSTEPGSGIVLQGAAPFSYEAGDEVEIGVLGSTLYRDGNGILVLKPASDGRVVRTNTSNTPQAPISIDVETLKGGTYESMYVAVANVEVILAHVKNIMEGVVTIENTDMKKFTMYTYPSCNFATENVPQGSGTLKGIASVYEGDYVMLPRNAGDYDLSAPRFGKEGITLPYIFSFKCAGADNNAGMTYSLWSDLEGVPLRSDGNFTTNPTIYYPEKHMVAPKDNSGLTMTFSLAGTPSATWAETGRVVYWYEASGHYNFPTSRWNMGNYTQIEVPLAEDVDGRIRFSFGLSAGPGAPREWKVIYSTDNLATWKDADAGVSIPAGLNVGGGKHFFYYSVFVTLAAKVEKGSTIYFRITPASTTTVNGTAFDLTKSEDVRFHSAMVWDKKPETTTATPAGALYFEAFDRIYGGYDYLWGDKLGGMVAYSGKDISTWDAAQKAGLSGTNVRERIGYVQLGFADNERYAPNNAGLVNNVGTLTTPTLSAITGTANVKVSFKAIAYKAGINPAYGNPNEGHNGDITNVVVKVTGGGTIVGGTDGAITVPGLSHSTFKDFSVDIDGATPDTQITFTSAPAGKEFSRWFIDDICVTAR